MKLSHIPTLRRVAACSALAAVSLLSGCATRLSPPITGYTCCNLRPDAGWLASSNYLGGPILPAGEPVVIDTAKRNQYFYGTIGGDYISMSDDSARGKEGGQRWLRKIVVRTDPKVELASWSPEVQSAVYSAKVAVGMTRPQVLMALSYPSPNDTKDLNANTWRYWTTQEDEPVDVHFGADGAVSSLSGKPAAVRILQFKR